MDNQQANKQTSNQIDMAIINVFFSLASVTLATGPVLCSPYTKTVIRYIIHTVNVYLSFLFLSLALSIDVALPAFFLSASREMNLKSPRPFDFLIFWVFQVFPIKIKTLPLTHIPSTEISSVNSNLPLTSSFAFFFQFLNRPLSRLSKLNLSMHIHPTL